MRRLFIGVLGLVSIIVAALVAWGTLGAPPASASQVPGLEFRLAVGNCDTAGDTKRTCSQAGTFTASVYLDSFAGTSSYIGVGVTVAPTGVTSNNDPDIVWPQCAFEAPAPPPNASASCSIGLPPEPQTSTFTGLMFTATFNCVQGSSGTLTLIHGKADTLLIDNNSNLRHEAGPDVLNINCPIDTDNDGCTDVQEMGGLVQTGGLRDESNFWDFADMPKSNTNDRLDRRILIDDIVRVLQRYNADDADGTAAINRFTDPLSPPPKTGYHPAFDRTVVGPNPWNLGPPSGRIRIDDVVNVILQYGHNCT